VKTPWKIFPWVGGLDCGVGSTSDGEPRVPKVALHSKGGIDTLLMRLLSHH
jgi:hypothetical protein